MINRTTALLLVVSVMLAMSLATAGCDLDGDAEEDPIVFADMGWDLLWINNAIAGFIIEEGYGYPVEETTVDTPVAQTAIVEGDIDIMMEVWKDQMRDWWEENVEEGNILDMGPTFAEGTQGFYVPRYVIEGDEDRGIEPMAPDLESVFDLKDHNHLFPDEADPDMGRIVIGVSGWEATAINEAKVTIYGLDDYFNAEEVGSTAAVEALMVSSHEAGDPLVVYYWEPTWLYGMYDFVMLEEPEHSPEVMAQLSDVASGEMDLDDLDEACGYEVISVPMGVYAGLKDRAPEVVEMLGNMKIGAEENSAAAGWMHEEDAEPEEAAIWYLENFEERWREWIPDEEVEQRIEEALIEAGADLGG